jgi:hypothetical protein
MMERRRPRPARRLRAGLEGFERRELLSGIIASLAARHDAPPAVHPAVVRAAVATPTPGANGLIPTGSVPDPAPMVPGQGTPTRHELAREQFTAQVSGTVIRGPGRFSDQSSILFYQGQGTASHSLHTSFRMGIVFPTDPTRPIVGAIYLQDRSSASANQVTFDLAVDPNSLDRFGRPTQAIFYSDPNVYSGLDYQTASYGTMKIRYFGNQAAIGLTGRVYTNGLTGGIGNILLSSFER